MTIVLIDGSAVPGLATGRPAPFSGMDRGTRPLVKRFAGGRH